MRAAVHTTYGPQDVVRIVDVKRPTAARIREMLVAGTFRPIVDHRYPFDRIVEAYRYVETGQKIGNVVITVP
jgi:NADPH:quinone reductase-like Zn-dependent oxidoreductase